MDSDMSGKKNDACSQTEPCATITRGLALNRTYFKLSGTIQDNLVVDDDRTVMVFGDGVAATTVAPRESATVCSIPTTAPASAAVYVYDLTIAMASVPSAAVKASMGLMHLERVTIRDGGDVGIKIDGNAQLKLTHSTLSNNTLGGLEAIGSSTFQATCNVFRSNGSMTSFLGAIAVSSDTTSSLIEFNTFYDNVATSGIGTDIQCRNGTSIPAVVKNSLLYRTTLPNNSRQFAGNCAISYSDVYPDHAPPGIGNLGVDPQFSSAPGDLRPASDSPLRGRADPLEALPQGTTDLAGVQRPPSSSPATPGAYEPHP